MYVRRVVRAAIYDYRERRANENDDPIFGVCITAALHRPNPQTIFEKCI